MNASSITKSHAVLWIGACLALPLWREFHEPGQPAWNMFLAAFLIAVTAAAYVGLQHLQRDGVEVGEARFTRGGGDAGADGPSRE